MIDDLEIVDHVAELFARGLKQCSKCKLEKPLDEFGNNSKMRFGKKSYCNSCHSQNVKDSATRCHGKPCIDCGFPLTKAASIRCRECSGKFYRGELHPAWKGGRTIDEGGYVLLSGHQDHPNCRSNGLIAEHVLVMSQVLGRALVVPEEVHHVNGVRDDNRPENLELWSKSHPSGQRVSDKVAWAIELLKLYAPEALKA